MTDINNASDILAAGTALATIRQTLEGVPFLLAPERYKVHSLEHLLPKPALKTAVIRMDDALSFSHYINHHKQPETGLYLELNNEASSLTMKSIIDDHAAARDGQQWRKHQVNFAPKLSKEWRDWVAGSNKEAMSQSKFAAFIEDHVADIIVTEKKPHPTASEMLQMALSFEHTANKAFKKKIDLGSGGVSLEFVDKADDATTQKMAIFERFTIGIPVFDHTDVAESTEAKQSVYPIEARLRYRQQDTALVFWYELIRPDLVFRQAAQDVIQTVTQATGLVALRGSAA